MSSDVATIIDSDQWLWICRNKGKLYFYQLIDKSSILDCGRIVFSVLSIWKCNSNRNIMAGPPDYLLIRYNVSMLKFYNMNSNLHWISNIQSSSKAGSDGIWGLEARHASLAPASLFVNWIETVDVVVFPSVDNCNRKCSYCLCNSSLYTPALSRTYGL